MWNNYDGKDVPDGWKLCDGSHGTPNLTGKFVVGKGGGYSLGNTGGAASVTLALDEMPLHNHNVTLSNKTTNNTGAHTHTYSKPVVQQRDGWSHTAGYAADNDTDWTNTNTSSAGGHHHTVNTTVSEQNRGSNQAHENRPPYYVIAYIMRKE